MKKYTKRMSSNIGRYSNILIYMDNKLSGIIWISVSIPMYHKSDNNTMGRVASTAGLDVRKAVSE